MKYIAITFDDGRQDTYKIAFPIMKKLGLCGTVFCTTGYIDGSWLERQGWYSAGDAITVDQLKEMYSFGWEIGLHGDKHLTEYSDLKTALMKMKKWGFGSVYGFSLPNSNVNEAEISRIIKSDIGKNIAYIRRGRKIDTRKVSTMLLFGLYSFLGVQRAYHAFNIKNIASISSIDSNNIYSIVIRFKDSPRMVIDFLAALPDDSCVVLMLHSILPKTNILYGVDSWFWDSGDFQKFCENIKTMNDVEILTVSEMLSRKRRINE